MERPEEPPEPAVIATDGLADEAPPPGRLIRLPELRTYRCPKGHNWRLTNPYPWAFLTFVDQSSQRIELRSCPFCLVEFLKANVPDAELVE
jgi:hypothetical protein